jgi:hypothetical protein
MGTELETSWEEKSRTPTDVMEVAVSFRAEQAKAAKKKKKKKVVMMMMKYSL